MTLKAKKRLLGGQDSGANARSYKDAGNTSTALTITVTDAEWQKCILTGNATITLAGAVSGQECTVVVEVVRDATTTRTLAWAGGTFKTPGGVALSVPLAVASSVNIYSFTSRDGGTTWYANTLGVGYA